MNLRAVVVCLGLVGMAFGAIEKPAAPTVFTEKVKAIALHERLTYPARLVSKTTAALLAETDGVVKKISSPLGRAVKRGEAVLTIANTDPIYQYAPMIVRSPVAGVVSAVEVTEGSRVAKGQRVALVTDPAQIKILIEVAAADLFAITHGSKGDLSVTSHDQQVPVEVIGVSPFVDSGTGTATVELSVAAHEKVSLPPGLIGKVSFKVREHQGVEVPESAVVYRGREPALRVVEKGKAKYVMVTLGPSRQGKVEIAKGVAEGSEVIVRSSGFVSEGEEVKVQPVEGPKS